MLNYIEIVTSAVRRAVIFPARSNCMEKTLVHSVTGLDLGSRQEDCVNEQQSDQKTFLGPLRRTVSMAEMRCICWCEMRRVVMGS